MPLIKYNIDPIDLQAKIKRLNLTQREVSKQLDVTDGAISGAINNDPLMKKLRKRLIQHLNSLQTDKTRKVI